MKKIVLFCLVIISFTVNGQTNTLNLIPQPVEVQQSAGFYKLTKTATIGYDGPESHKIAGMLAQKLEIPTGFTIHLQEGKKSSIQFVLNRSENPKLGTEGYTLETSAKGVVIAANKPEGLFYGMQTLLQLLPKEIESKTALNQDWAIPFVNITDYPRFAWRGILLDVARNFFSKASVEQYIDQIARFKYNTFHWHLTDDQGWRIEIKSLPKLTEVGAWRVPRNGYFGERADPKPGEKATDGGFYTQEDIREIIEYAKARYVTIIPEIDVPGHSMAAVASYPELSCTKNPDARVNPGTHFADWYGNGTFKMFIDNTLNPSDEKVYEFLDKVFTEVAALFPNPYIHVGGDECYKGYWSSNQGCIDLMKKLNIRHVEDLQGYFMNRVEGILKSKGKKLLGWDEILDGGISPEATLMSWRGIKGGIEAAKMGHNVVMTPTDFTYIDYQQGEKSIEPPIYADLRLKKCYSFEPVPQGVDPKYILGGQGNLWAEQLETLRSAEYMTWPRGWALAEVFWSAKNTKDYTNFIQRVEKQFDRADIEQVGYSKAIYDPVITIRKKDGNKILEMESEAPGLDIYYCTDGSMPDNFSKKYTGTVAIPEGPVTLRLVTYRDGKPLGHLIALSPEELEKRAVK